MAGSVLEKFIILFQADSDSVKKGAKEAKATIDKLQNSLQASDKTTQKLGVSFLNLAKQAAVAFSAFVSVQALTSGIQDAAEYAARLNNLSKQFGISVEALDAWGQAVSKNGGNAQAFFGTLQKMTTSLTEFAATGTSSILPFFRRLNIRLVNSQGQVKSFVGLLPELADSFSRMSKIEAFGFGKKLGLDTGTILLLQKGKKGLEEILLRQKELGLVTQKDAAIAAEFNKSWKDATQIFRIFFIRVNSFILPLFTKLSRSLDKFKDFWRNHTDFIVGSISAIGTTLTVLLLPALIKTSVAAVRLSLPLLLIASAGAAVGLVYDDLTAFFKGNLSVTGELVKKYPLLGRALKVIADVIPPLKKVFVGLFTLILSSLEKIIFGAKFTAQVFNKLGHDIKALWQTIKEFVLGTIDKIISAATKIKGFFKGKKQEVSFVQEGKQALEVTSGFPLNALSGNALRTNAGGGNKSFNFQTGNINIETQATDADGISKSIGDTLEKQMQQAIANFDSGVAA